MTLQDVSTVGAFKTEEGIGVKNRDLTGGNVTKSLLYFAGPMILGNLLQQCYNIADIWVVRKYVGARALAAVKQIGVLGIWGGQSHRLGFGGCG